MSLQKLPSLGSEGKYFVGMRRTCNEHDGGSQSIPRSFAKAKAPQAAEVKHQPCQVQYSWDPCRLRHERKLASTNWFVKYYLIRPSTSQAFISCLPDFSYLTYLIDIRERILIVKC